MNKIDPKKLLAPSKESAIQKKLDSSVLVPIKNISISSKKIILPKESKKETEGGDKLIPVIIEIKTKVIEIEKLLLSNNKLLRKQFKDDRKTIEDEKRREKEEKLETKKSKKDKFPNLKKPDLPRTGIIDYIKNFLTWVIIGKAFTLFVKYLPKLLEFVKKLKPLYEFFKTVTGALFNGLVTFVEWTDKAGKKVREIAGALGGEPFQKAFDDFSGALTTFANLALIAGMATMGGTDFGLGGGGGGRSRGGGSIRDGLFQRRKGKFGVSRVNTERGINYRRDRTTGDTSASGDTLRNRRIDKLKKSGRLTFDGKSATDMAYQQRKGQTDVIKKYIDKYGRKNALKRFGQETVGELGGKYSRSGITNFARRGAVSVLGKGGTKAALTGVKAAAKVITPLVRNLPLIGGIMEFILSWVSGDGIGKAAFKGIGAGLGTWIGGAIGSLIPIPGVGTGIGMWLGSMGGSALGEAIYDKIFNNKDPGKKGSQKAQKKETGGTIKPKKGKPISSKTAKAKRQSGIVSKRLKKISIKKIKPGKDVGGNQQVEKLYPNPDSKSPSAGNNGFSWMNFIFGNQNNNGSNEDNRRKKRRLKLKNKLANKIPNATKALLGIADVLEKSGTWISYLVRAGIEVAMGQLPDTKSLASIISNVFTNIRNSGANLVTKELIGFAGGGEIALSSSSSFRYLQETLPLEKTIERDLKTTLQDALNVVKSESKKRGVGRDEMLEDNRRGGSDDPNEITTLGSGGGSLKDLTDQDFDDLAYIVSGEAARGTDDEYGVAAAVLNRVASPVWPNTIMGVGTQSGQFEAVEKGTARRDPALAKKLKDNQGKIADALNKLNGRDSFKGQSQLDNKGSSDIMFDPKGNFYHYRQQVRKSDPEPTNIDQSWKKLLGPSTGGSFSTPSPSGQPDDKNIPSSVPKGSVMQWLHGNPNRAGYRADHGGQYNAHDHFSFNSRQAAVAAFLKLKKAGYQPYEFEGYTTVGDHSPTGGHYGPVGSSPTYGDTSDGTAFDIPWATYGSGPIKQSDYDKSYRAAQIVGAAQGGGPLNNISKSLNTYSDDLEIDYKYIIQPILVSNQSNFAVSSPTLSSPFVKSSTKNYPHNFQR